MILLILICVLSLCFCAKEKDDPESKKIYTIVSLVGAAVAAVSALLLFL